MRALELLQLAILMAVMPFYGIFAFAASECKAPSHVTLNRDQAVRTLGRDKAYVEGLIFSGGALWESDGIKGLSGLRRIDPYTGMTKEFRVMEAEYFGEGLAEVNHEFVQLTYKQNVAFIYGAHDAMIAHPGEHWGLTQLGGELIESNGKSSLLVLDPNTLKVRRKIKVRLGTRPLDNLNELEVAHDRIFANIYKQDPALTRIYGKDLVVVINPATGCVERTIDLSELRQPEMNDPSDSICRWPVCYDEDFVANGIAFDEGRNELYFTGKNWPYIFVFQFSQVNPTDSSSAE
jgi:glutaminyl-peptide cyclotransferase